MRFLLLLALIAVALVVRAPAWLAAREVQQASSGMLDLQNTSGTLWRGQGDLVIHGPRPVMRETPAGAVRWNVERVDLARKIAIIKIEQSPPGPQPLTMTLGVDGVDLAGSALAPAAVAMSLPLLAGWTLAGVAAIETPALQWANGSAAGTAIVHWRNAALFPPDLPGGFALGDVDANATVSGGVTGASLRNKGGDVELAIDASSQTGKIALLVQPRNHASAAQVAWLQSHTMGRTPQGFRVDIGWPGR